MDSDWCTPASGEERSPFRHMDSDGNTAFSISYIRMLPLWGICRPPWGLPSLDWTNQVTMQAARAPLLTGPAQVIPDFNALKLASDAAIVSVSIWTPSFSTCSISQSCQSYQIVSYFRYTLLPVPFSTFTLLLLCLNGSYAGDFMALIFCVTCP